MDRTLTLEEEIESFCKCYMDGHSIKTGQTGNKRKIVMIGELTSYQQSLDEYDKRNLDASKGEDWRNPDFDGPQITQYKGHQTESETLIPMTAYIMVGRCEVFLHAKDFDYEKEYREHENKAHFKQYGCNLYEPETSEND